MQWIRGTVKFVSKSNGGDHGGYSGRGVISGGKMRNEINDLRYSSREWPACVRCGVLAVVGE